MFLEIDTVLPCLCTAGRNEDGVIVDGDRLFNTDEKGFSQRANSVSRGVVARHQSSRACAATSSPTWQHITVASFISLSGRRYPTGVVVSTSSLHNDFKKLWPQAFFYPNKGGSVTSAIFADMVVNCMAKPAREFIPTGKPLILCLDSGGGSWLHLSAAFLKACLTFGIKPFYYPAWTTKALCPLDQCCHSTMARLCSQWKQLWANKQQPLTLFTALKACGQIVDEALQPDSVRASWSQCGFRLNEPFNHNKIFIQRKREIF